MGLRQKKVGNNMPKPRQGTQIELTDDAWAQIDQYCGNRLKKKGVIEQILIWFASQDKTVQTLVLNAVDDEDRAGVARVVLKRIASESRQRRVEIEDDKLTLAGSDE